MAIQTDMNRGRGHVVVLELDLQAVFNENAAVLNKTRRIARFFFASGILCLGLGIGFMLASCNFFKKPLRDCEGNQAAIAVVALSVSLALLAGAFHHRQRNRLSTNICEQIVNTLLGRAVNPTPTARLAWPPPEQVDSNRPRFVF